MNPNLAKEIAKFTNIQEYSYLIKYYSVGKLGITIPRSEIISMVDVPSGIKAETLKEASNFLGAYNVTKARGISLKNGYNLLLTHARGGVSLYRKIY